MFDLIIRNGHLMDPRCNLDKQADIGIKGRHIVDIGNLEGKECLQSVDAKGCLVVPGLIDFHAHAAYGISDFSMPADLVQIPSGVTSMVDAGSTGVTDFEAFYHRNIITSIMTVKSFLHVASEGHACIKTLLTAMWRSSSIRSIALAAVEEAAAPAATPSAWTRTLTTAA